MLAPRLGRIASLLSISFVMAMAFVSFAQTTQPAGPVGTWKWTTAGPGGEQETVLKIKQDGDKLAGTITGFGGEDSPISEAKFANGELTFKVVRDFGGQSFTTLYTGKIDGANFKGKSQMIFEQPIDAKRDK